MDINLTTGQVKKLMAGKKESLLIVDVREPHEYAEGHILGSILVPLGDVAAHIDRFPKDKTILFVCRSGRRSLEAANLFLENGYTEVFNYQGGMLAWNGAVERGLYKGNSEG